MRVLIDECIDERFRNSFPGHDCQTARYAGLAGLKNGDLLTAAETAGFEIFITVDQGIAYQQNLTKHLSHHSPCEIEPPSRLARAPAGFPRLHRIHPSW